MRFTRSTKPSLKCVCCWSESQINSLKLENGLLYRKFVPVNLGSQVVWQLVVPKQQRTSLFSEAHAGATSGHFAHKQTLEKLRQSAYWPGMSRDVEEWCRSCAACARRRSPVLRSQNRAPLGHRSSSPIREDSHRFNGSVARDINERTAAVSPGTQPCLPEDNLSTTTAWSTSAE